MKLEGLLKLNLKKRDLVMAIKIKFVIKVADSAKCGNLSESNCDHSITLINPRRRHPSLYVRDAAESYREC